METTNIKIAAGVELDNATLYDVEGLVRLFRGVGGSNKKYFKDFCKGVFAWRYPNADLVRFNFCPITGVKIDWEQVLRDGLELLS